MSYNHYQITRIESAVVECEPLYSSRGTGSFVLHLVLFSYLILLVYLSVFIFTDLKQSLSLRAGPSGQAFPSLHQHLPFFFLFFFNNNNWIFNFLTLNQK